ncbi:MAG: hypothetical protein K5745_00255 [Saccharofermentans sp.]|nr:hypothetical protein [Saccharofermentans sp.]
MSDKVKSIVDKMRSDPELSRKYGEEIKKLRASKAATSDGELVCMAIKNVTGEDVTIADLERLKADTQEISEDELEKVSGGKTNWCWFDYCCWDAFKHPSDTGMSDACFFDFSCFSPVYMSKD